MGVRKEIIKYVIQVLATQFPEHADMSFEVDKPADEGRGEYAANVAFILSKKIRKPPREIAEFFKNELSKESLFAKVEVAGPGFINFYIDSNILMEAVKSAGEDADFGKGSSLRGKKIMVEFAHPNTHKAFHIGHLRNISLGESLVRILESQGAKVFRANYQGDIGLHVAKFLWGYMHSKATESPPNDIKKRQEFMGKIYAKGGKAYEEDETVHEEINDINRRLYKKDKALLQMWKTTRDWSLEYFEHIYRLLSSHFDHLFFESEVYESGLSLVREGVEKGIFEESQGAIIFPGSKYGLHDRVFITGDGHATYEGKDIGLAKLQMEAFPFDTIMHVVANEQDGYFKVLIKA